MSRSFKKHPGYSDKGKYTYQDKRLANKKVRNTEDIPNGSSFKKVFCSYDICDWKYNYYSYRQVVKEVLWEYENNITPLEEVLAQYYRAITK